MQDLSHLFADGPVNALCPTSQSAGNTTHENNACTAPGSEPAGQLTSLPGQEYVHPAPDVAAIDVPRTTVTRGDAAGLRGGRPVLRMGEWNDMGGGGGPRA